MLLIYFYAHRPPHGTLMSSLYFSHVLHPPTHQPSSEVTDDDTDHPWPALQLYGRAGILWIDRELETISKQAFERRYAALIQASERWLADPSPWPTAHSRHVVYKFRRVIARLFFTHGSAFSYTSTTALEPRRVAELLDVCELMLQRGELVRMVIDEAAETAADLDEEPQRRRAYHLLQRMHDALDDRSVRLGVGELDELGEPEKRKQRRLKLRNQLDEHLNTLAALLPDLERRRQVPWHDAELLFAGEEVARSGWIEQTFVRGSHLYACVATPPASFRGGNVRRTWHHLLRISLDTGEYKELHDWHVDHSSSKYDTHALGTNAWAAANRKDGIHLFPLNTKVPYDFTVENGLPTNDVRNVTFLDNTVYATLGDAGYLVACDLATKEVRVLVSPRRRELRSPLDNTGRLTFDALFADPARQRIFFSVVIPEASARKEPRHGLWSYNVQTGRFEQRLRLFGGYRLDQRVGHAPSEHRLLSRATAVFAYDLQHDGVELLTSRDPTRIGPNLELDESPSRTGAHPHPPYLVHGGWLWTGAGAARIELATGRREVLPLLAGEETNGGSRAFTGCLQVFDNGQQMLIGNHERIWLLTFDP